MPEFILGIGEGHVWRASFVRLVGIIVIAWISAQSAALAQSADNVGALNDQAVQLYSQGKYAEALKQAEQARVLAEEVLGPEHPDTLRSVNNLAVLYETQGRYSEAEPLYQRALAGSETALGPEHPSTLRSVNNLGFLYQTRQLEDERDQIVGVLSGAPGIRNEVKVSDRPTLRSRLGEINEEIAALVGLEEQNKTDADQSDTSGSS